MDIALDRPATSLVVRNLVGFGAPLLSHSLRKCEPVDRTHQWMHKEIQGRAAGRGRLYFVMEKNFIQGPQ